MANATVMQTPAVTPKGAKMLPFRMATVERSEVLPGELLTMSAAQQKIIRDVQGDGFLYSIGLEMVGAVAGNAAAVAFAEDAPWNALSNPILKDVNGDLINLKDGFELYLCNLAAGNYRSPASSSSLYTATTGAGATGGSFSFLLEMPAGINRRDLIGIVGNQDRAQKYQLRTDLADAASVYATAPADGLGAAIFPSVAINKYYENYSVPLSHAPDGSAQQQLPDKYGVLHFLTSSVDPTAPSAGTKNHYLQRIGNTVRFIILVFRQGVGATPRAAAETIMNAATGPATVTFKVGSDTIFNESYRYRRWKMQQRYGFDWPSGVLVYDTMHDFGPAAGMELGNDWYHTAGIANAQFLINYPSGYAATASNSLTVITDDLIGM